ncbi:MAG: hypothetical protein JWM53_640, partial [bacterium]|nr:hypothetical protein [bacterium]
RLERLGSLGRDVKIALVGCGARKQPGTHAARDLYTGSLFRAAFAHAERTADEVYIVSALCGLVAPDAQLEAYERALNAYGKHEREAWADRIVSHLAERFAGLRVRITIYAGAAYALELEAAIRRNACRVRVESFAVPLERLPLGKRLAWFKAARQQGRDCPAIQLCRTCRRILPFAHGTERCDACHERAERRQAARAQCLAQRQTERDARAQKRAEARAARKAKREAEARARRDRQLQRDIKRREQARWSDALNRDAMARYAAEQRAGQRSPLAMHCSGYVAAGGVLYTSAEYHALETRPSGRYTGAGAEPAATEAP